MVVEVDGMTHQVETDYRGLNHFDRWGLSVGGKYRLSKGSRLVMDVTVRMIFDLGWRLLPWGTSIMGAPVLQARCQNQWQSLNFNKF